MSFIEVYIICLIKFFNLISSLSVLNLVTFSDESTSLNGRIFCKVDLRYTAINGCINNQCWALQEAVLVIILIDKIVLFVHYLVSHVGMHAYNGNTEPYQELRRMYAHIVQEEDFFDDFNWVNTALFCSDLITVVGAIVDIKIKEISKRVKIFDKGEKCICGLFVMPGKEFCNFHEGFASIIRGKEGYSISFAEVAKRLVDDEDFIDSIGWFITRYVDKYNSLYGNGYVITPLLVTTWHPQGLTNKTIVKYINKEDDVAVRVLEEFGLETSFGIDDDQVIKYNPITPVEAFDVQRDYSTTWVQFSVMYSKLNSIYNLGFDLIAIVALYTVIFTKYMKLDLNLMTSRIEPNIDPTKNCRGRYMFITLNCQAGELYLLADVNRPIYEFLLAPHHVKSSESKLSIYHKAGWFGGHTYMQYEPTYQQKKIDNEPKYE